MIRYKEYISLLSEDTIYSANISSINGFVNGMSGRGNNNATVLINDKGEFGFFDKETKPYTPIGGRKALVDLFKSNPELFTFKKYEYGKGFTIKRGRKV